MDHLKEGIGLRGYGQKDPLVEYKKESFKLFQDMMDRIEDETIRFLFFMQPYEEHRHGPVVAVPEIEEWDEEEAQLANGTAASNGTGDHHAAQTAFEDFTRNIQRKKEKELADLQFVGGDGTSPRKAASSERSEGRPQRSMSMRKRQEVQKMSRRFSLGLVPRCMPVQARDSAGAFGSYKRVRRGCS